MTCTGGVKKVSDNDEKQDDSAVEVAQTTFWPGSRRGIWTSQAAMAGQTSSLAVNVGNNQPMQLAFGRTVI